MTKIRWAVYFVLVSLTACATNGVKTNPVYSMREKNKLALCMAMADTATNVAINKLDGAPIEKMKEHYAKLPKAELNNAIVDKVYEDKFTSSWDYTIAFFKHCEVNVADIPAQRGDSAAFCMQSALIADISHSYKQQGAPLEKAYAHFSKMDGKVANPIVENVYSKNQTRAEAKYGAWDSCMQAVTASQ